jgi:hypothetical protein
MRHFSETSSKTCSQFAPSHKFPHSTQYTGVHTNHLDRGEIIYDRDDREESLLNQESPPRGLPVVAETNEDVFVW